MDEWTLNDLLECSVCLERLDTSSKVLPCQHTFCKKCLEEIVTTHKELRCPECRILVEAKIDELPPNVLLMRILEGMRNAGNPVSKKRGPVVRQGTQSVPASNLSPSLQPSHAAIPENNRPLSAQKQVILHFLLSVFVTFSKKKNIFFLLSLRLTSAIRLSLELFTITYQKNPEISVLKKETSLFCKKK